MKKKILTFMFLVCLVISSSLILTACGETTTSTTPKQYSISIDPLIQNGTIVANKTSAFYGDEITLTVTPNEGYQLVDNSLKYNESVVYNNTFTMPAQNVTITAQFSKETHRISIFYWNGKAEANKTAAAEGETITLTLTPDTGYILDSLTYNDIPIVGNSFVMPNADVHILAWFKKPAYQINIINPQEGGSISTGLSFGYEGDKRYIYPNAQLGYMLEPGSLKCDGVVIDNADNEFIMPAHDVTITANFVKKVYKINYNTDAQTTHSNPTTNFYHDVIRLRDAKKDGFLFLGWFKDADLTIEADTVFNNHEDVLTLYPKFEADPVTQGLNFKLLEDKQGTSYYAVESYSGTDGEVIIPNTYQNIQVTSILANALKDNLTISSLKMGNNIKTMEYGAFLGCSNLNKVTLSTNLANIASNAFNSTNITSITIPNNVKTIDSSAFENCTNLETLTFGDDVYLSKLGDFAFKNCTKLKRVHLPLMGITIGTNPFMNCSSLESITSVPLGSFVPQNSNIIMLNGVLISGCKNSIIPLITYTYGNNNNLTYRQFKIGKYAFAGTSIEKLVFSDVITGVEEGAFKDCVNLTKVLIYSQTTSIGKDAFSGCENLVKISYMGTEAKWNDITKGENYKNNCPATIEYYNLHSHISSGSTIRQVATVYDDSTPVLWNGLKRNYFINETLSFTGAKINFFDKEYVITEDMVTGFDAKTTTYGQPFGRQLSINIEDTNLNIKIGFEYSYDVISPQDYIKQNINKKFNSFSNVKATTISHSGGQDTFYSIQIKTADSYFTTTNLNYITDPVNTPIPTGTKWIVKNNDSENYTEYENKINTTNSGVSHCFPTTSSNGYIPTMYSIPSFETIPENFESGTFVLEWLSISLEVENWIPKKYYDYIYSTNNQTGVKTKILLYTTTFEYENIPTIPPVAQLDYMEYFENSTFRVSGIKAVYDRNETINPSDITITLGGVDYVANSVLCPFKDSFYIMGSGSNAGYKMFKLALSFNDGKYCAQILVKVNP